MFNLQDTSFHGHAAGYFLLRPVASADTFKNKLAVVEKTNKQFVIPRLEIDNFIQAYSPDPTDHSTMTVDAVTIQLATWNIYTQFNPLDFKEHWFAGEMQEELVNAPLPQTAQTFLIQHMLDRHNLFVDQLFWRGDTRFNINNPNYRTATSVGLSSVDGRTNQQDLNQFDGVIKQLLSASDTIQVSGAVPLTATNSVAALQSVYNSIPTALIQQYGDEGLKFVFSRNTLRLIEQNYNITTTFKNYNYDSPINNLFLQYEMVPVSGCPDNTIVAMYMSDNPQRSNLFFAVNSEKDMANLVMDKVSPKSDEWFIKGIIKANVGVGWTDQAVIYTTLTY